MEPTKVEPKIELPHQLSCGFFGGNYLLLMVTIRNCLVIANSTLVGGKKVTFRTLAA